MLLKIGHAYCLPKDQQNLLDVGKGIANITEKSRGFCRFWRSLMQNSLPELPDTSQLPRICPFS